MSSILIKNGTIVTADGAVDADVVIGGNRIQKILKRPYEPGLISQSGTKFDEEMDISGKLLFPGLIDCHVHFREPGLEQKETIATGAAAALAGGVTTVCEMPNTIPPTVTVGAFADKVRRITNHESRITKTDSRHPKCDIRFFFGATESKHLIAFRKIWLREDVHLKKLRARCCGLKLYFDHSTGNQGADARVIEEAFKLCADLGAVVVCHCEDAKMNHELRMTNDGSNDISVHSRLRPPESEEKAIRDALRLAKKYGTRLHIAHLSTRQGLELVRQAKKEFLNNLSEDAGLVGPAAEDTAEGKGGSVGGTPLGGPSTNVTCEVAPHHLFLSIDDYKTLGTLGKMNPPLRAREHQEALWAGIADGTVDCISTDHAPHALEEKNCDDPLKAPSGVPGVETMVPLLLTAVRDEILTYPDIVRLCFENPNRIFGLRKEGIREGAPADIVLVDPQREWVIHGKELHSKCGWTPYEGWKIRGKVLRHTS